MKLKTDGRRSSMDIKEVMAQRHSVRQYKSEDIDDRARQLLDDYLAELNKESGLNMQIIYNEPDCFNSRMAKYGKFDYCENYICLVGRKDDEDLEEKCGYYGELLVLKAQELGLNTCWVGLTHGTTTSIVEKGEKEVIVIALGYGKTQGVPHKSKPLEKLSNLTAYCPKWFEEGVEAAALAPTAMNQQKFYFTLLDDNKVEAKTTGLPSAYIKVDLGIAKAHFELGAGKENFTWA